MLWIEELNRGALRIHLLPAAQASVASATRPAGRPRPRLGAHAHRQALQALDRF